MSESGVVSPPALSVAELPDDPETLLGALAALEQPDVGVSLLIYVLIAVCVLALMLVVAGLRRWWRRRRRRREAMRWMGAAESSLEQLRERLQISPQEHGNESDIDAQTRRDILAEASVLARRVALVAERRAVIAPLAGDDWLAELDRLTGEGERFQRGAGRALAVGPYEASPRYSRDNLDAVLTDLEALIEGVAKHQRLSFTHSP